MFTVRETMTYSDASIMHRGIGKASTSDNILRNEHDDTFSLDSWSDALDSMNEQPLTSGQTSAKSATGYRGHEETNTQGRKFPNMPFNFKKPSQHYISDGKQGLFGNINILKKSRDVKESVPIVPITKTVPFTSSSRISDQFSINGETDDSDSHMKSQSRRISKDRGSCSVDQHPTRRRSKHLLLPQDVPHTSSDFCYNDKHVDSRRLMGQHTRLRTDETSRDQIVDGEKVKTKLMSAWNNMKYGWTLKTKTNFRYDSPIYLLGRLYHRDRQAEERDPIDDERNQLKNVSDFYKDYSSRIWFTYRREFSPLAGTKMTTDCGWGCMLRSCQMMIAQAFVLHFLGREWRLFDHQTTEQNTFYHEIIRWFGDHESDNVPFSLHKLVNIGFRLGKSPGDWYGPSSVSFIFRDALIKAEQSLPVLSNICLYVAHDCTVYIEDVIDLCTANRKSSLTSSTSSDTSETKPATISTQTEWKRAVIILIPMRLGGESLNEIYIPCVQNMLSHENCIGVIGGKPKHSMYFVGFQEDKLIYMDPHYCQDIVNTAEQDFPVQTFRCVSPRKLPFSKMDPSCTVGFYCKTYEDFMKFKDEAQKFVAPPKQKGQYPLFIFSEGRGTDVSHDSYQHKEKGLLKIKHYKMHKDTRVRSATIESEEFVIL